MENIYQLTGRYAEMNDRYEQLTAQLQEMYEENGGEETEVTEEMQSVLDELDSLKDDILKEIVQNADSYAEIALNKAAQRKVLEAELKAVKEEQAKVVARYQARINGLARSEEWWKENFAVAMQVNNMDKIGGAKTGHKYSIFFKKSVSLDVDSDLVLAPFQEAIDKLRENLPAWVTPEFKINKTELKKEENLPAGADLIENKTLQIR